MKETKMQQTDIFNQARLFALILAFFLCAATGVFAASPYAGLYEFSVQGSFASGFFSVAIGNDGTSIMLGISSTNTQYDSYDMNFPIGQNGQFSFTANGNTFNGSISGGPTLFTVSGVFTPQSGPTSLISGSGMPFQGDKGLYAGTIAGGASGSVRIFNYGSGGMWFYVEQANGFDYGMGGAAGTVFGSTELTSGNVSLNGSLNSSTHSISAYWSGAWAGCGNSSGTLNASMVSTFAPTTPWPNMSWPNSMRWASWCPKT